MVNPVVAADGYTYERSAIEEWIAKGKLYSPMTNAPLENSNLLPNQFVKTMILNMNAAKNS